MSLLLHNYGLVLINCGNCGSREHLQFIAKLITFIDKAKLIDTATSKRQAELIYLQAEAEDNHEKSYNDNDQHSLFFCALVSLPLRLPSRCREVDEDEVDVSQRSSSLKIKACSKFISFQADFPNEEKPIGPVQLSWINITFREKSIPINSPRRSL